MIAENVPVTQMAASGANPPVFGGAGGCSSVPIVTSPSDKSTGVGLNMSLGNGMGSWQSEPAFNGVTGQAGLTIDGVYRYTKEADQITIPPLPEVRFSKLETERP